MSEIAMCDPCLGLKVRQGSKKQRQNISSAQKVRPVETQQKVALGSQKPDK